MSRVLFGFALCHWTIGLSASVLGFSANAAVPVGAYTYWTWGTARTLSLAGATVSEGQAGSSVFENPASMGFQEGWLTGTLGWGSPRERGLLSSRETSLQQGYRVMGLSLSFWETMSLGAGMEELHLDSQSADDAGLHHEFRDEITSLDLSASLRLGSFLSLGVTRVSHESRRRIELRSVAGERTSAESQAIGASWRFGLLGRPNRTISFGISFRGEGTFRPSYSGAQQARLFGESYEPRMTQVAVSLHPFPDQSFGGFSEAFLVFQCDAINFSNVPAGGHLYYAPAAVFGAQDSYLLRTDDTFIPRLAVELPVWNNEYFGFIYRMGSYFEPEFVKGKPGRLHGTAGVLLRLWYFAIQGAVDSAKQYQNWNYGFGLELEF